MKDTKQKTTIPLIQSDVEGASYGLCENDQGCAAVSVSDLSLSYGDFEVFKNIDLNIRPCEVTALVGPSGCGKTSFLQCINRLVDLIPESKASGSIKLGTKEVLSLDCDLIKLRRQVGMVFQKPSPFPFSILKNFHIPLREHGIKSACQRESIMIDALKQVGLWSEIKDRLKTSATKLSGGQQQRLCLARTLALNPEIILMDEPTSSLDPVAAGNIETLIRELRGNYSIVVVTHNLSQARRVSDNTAVFWRENNLGCLLEHGPTEQIFKEPSSQLTSEYISGARG